MLQVTEKNNLLPVTSLLVTSYYPTLHTGFLVPKLMTLNERRNGCSFALSRWNW